MNNEANPFEGLLRSFYSASFYRRVARLWRPVSLAYLFFVLVLGWTPTIVKMHIQINRWLTHVKADVLPKIPTVRFQNGEISTPESRPYVLNFGTDKTPLTMIIDTSGRILSLDGVQAQFLLTKHKIFIRQQTGEVRMYDLTQSRTRAFVFNQATLVRALHPLKYGLLGALYAFLFILSYIKRLIQAFFLALLGLVVVAWMKADLDLGALLSLAIVAMTPEILVGTLIDLPGKRIPFEWLLLGLLVTGYFIFALNAASDKTAADAETGV